MKTLVVSVAIIAITMNCYADAFVQSHVNNRSAQVSAISLNATGRRRILKGLRRVFFAAGAISTAKVDPALAENSIPGRIVEIQLENVDGVPGNSGSIRILLRPQWAPSGVQRFEELTEQSFWDDCRIFRVIPGFIAQFGINGDPVVQNQWRSSSIADDSVKVTNKRGTVVFATAGPDTRTSQIFINTRNEGNSFLDNQGFAPIGEVIEGMDLVDKFYAGYGEGSPSGNGPNQSLIQSEGNSYLSKHFPNLTYISRASFV